MPVCVSWSLSHSGIHTSASPLTCCYTPSFLLHHSISTSDPTDLHNIFIKPSTLAKHQILLQRTQPLRRHQLLSHKPPSSPLFTRPFGFLPALPYLTALIRQTARARLPPCVQTAFPRCRPSLKSRPAPPPPNPSLPCRSSSRTLPVIVGYFGLCSDDHNLIFSQLSHFKYQKLLPSARCGHFSHYEPTSRSKISVSCTPANT